VKFFVGASETLATLRLLGKEELGPGEEGWIQLELRDPVVAVRGDRYILRRPSPGETLGGGAIVDHQPRGRHKRFDEEVLRSLESLAKGTPGEILFEAALAMNAAPIKEMIERSRLESATADAALQELLTARSLIQLEAGTPTITSDLLVIALPHFHALRDQTLGIVQSYHKSFPLRRGIPREELKSRLKLSTRIFNGLISSLVNQQLLLAIPGMLSMPGHEVTFDGGQQVQVQSLMRKFEQNPFSPPGVKESQAEVGEEVINALVERGDFIIVSSDVVFRKEDYDVAVKRIKDVLLQNETLTLAEVRDLFTTSRKYAQALLEHLDAVGLTLRDGDYRRLRKR
jgi:selenocysteine-specific elongation factor